MKTENSKNFTWTRAFIVSWLSNQVKEAMKVQRAEAKNKEENTLTLRQSTE